MRCPEGGGRSFVVFSLPCVRGGGRRGTSLTKGLLNMRNSHFTTLPPRFVRILTPLGTLPYTGRAIIRRLPQSPSVTAPPNPPQKNASSFFGDPGGGAKGSFATPSVSLRSTAPLIYPKKRRIVFLGALEGAKGSDGSNNKKRKTPASCLVGAFLAIGLSINQTVVSEITSSKMMVESIVFGS